jgi:acetyltransferase
MAALVRYKDVCNRPIGRVKSFKDVEVAKSKAIITQAQTDGRQNLTAAEVYSILQAYKIPVAEWRIALTATEAEQAAAEIGYPVVVKADAEKIVHKSDMGGVAANLTKAQSVREAVGRMELKFKDSADLKFLVQKHLPSGLEVILGAKAEEGLGHLIMFGLGGIYVEVLKDVVFELTPVTNVEAVQMLASIKGAALLKGVRGQAGVDQDALAEIILRLSQLVSDLPEIKEMDLNPVLAYEDQAVAVDARIRI